MSQIHIKTYSNQNISYLDNIKTESQIFLCSPFGKIIAYRMEIANLYQNIKSSLSPVISISFCFFYCLNTLQNGESAGEHLFIVV